MKVSQSMPLNDLERTFLARERFRTAETMILKATFEAYEIEGSGRQRFVHYTIHLHNLLLDFRIKKRFSDFEKFDLQIRAKYPKEPFPRLPEKFYINNFERSKLLARMAKLERYLNELLFEFENKDPMTEISEFIGLRKQEKQSILDLNQSNYQFGSKAELAFVKLVYQTEDLQMNIEELKQLIFSAPQTLKTARFLMKGDKNIKSIFALAFDSNATCFCSKEEQKLGPRKIRFSSFNENNQTARADSTPGRRPGLATTIGGRPKEETQVECPDCKTNRSTIHFTCSAVLSFLLELLDYSKNPNVEVFRAAFKEVEIGFIDHENFRKHLCASEFTVCKIHCYQLLKIYKDLSKSSKQFNECLLFNKNEEYRSFLNWYQRQNHCSRRDALYADHEQQFPKIDQLLLQESLHRDSLFRTMDFFAEKNVLNTIMIDEQRQLAKINFLANDHKKNELIDSLLDFKWNPRVQKILRQSSLNSNALLMASDHIFNLYIFYENPEESIKSDSCFIQWLKVYRVDKAQRTVFLLAPQTIDEGEKEDILCRLSFSEKEVNLPVEAKDFGLFIDIEPSREAKGKILVSILVNYVFGAKQKEKLGKELRDLKDRIRLAKKYCDQFNL